MDFDLTGSYDDLLEDIDMQELQSIAIIKRTLISLFKKDFLINLMIESIDESDCLGFRSDRDRKINVNNTSLSVIFNAQACIDKYSSITDDSTINDKIQYLSEIVEREFIQEYITKLTNVITESKEYLDTLNENLKDNDVFKENIREDSIVNLLSFSSTFSVMISDDYTTAYIQYLD